MVDFTQKTGMYYKTFAFIRNKANAHSWKMWLRINNTPCYGFEIMKLKMREKNSTTQAES